MKQQLDAIDRKIINRLQNGLEICEEPFAEPAAAIGIDPGELLARLARLKSLGVLSRVGPMYNSARFGGGLTLCAMAVPDSEFEQVAEIVNGFAEVAHNYQRDHAFNMWFVLATEKPERVETVLTNIEHLTGVKVLNLPKLEEYFIGLKVEA